VHYQQPVLTPLFSETPGKVVRPVVKYEHGSIVSDSYDPRTSVRGYLLPSQSIPPAY